MPKTYDFQIASIQAAIFTPGLQFVTGKLLSAILSTWGETFDGEPQSIPTLPDMPPEIPRITLQSKNGNYKWALAPARTDAFWLRKNPEDQMELSEFLSFAYRVFIDFLAITKGQVGRMACILRRFLKDSDPGRTLTEHFCQERWLRAPFNRPENFELHAHKRSRLAQKYDINSWVRCKTGNLSGPGGDPKSIILVEQDINTIAEQLEQRVFSPDELGDFFGCVPQEIDHVLSLYFPEETSR